MEYNEFYLRARRAELAKRERTEHSNNCMKARGLQRLWIRFLIWRHTLGIRGDNRLLARYANADGETEFCTVTLVERARRVHLINQLKMRL